MERGFLVHLPVLVSVAQHKSFAGAAAALGMSPSAASHAVKAVEDALGQPLFMRTTRSVSLTEAGEELLPKLQAALEDIDAATEALAAQRGQVTGVLRINSSRVAFGMALTRVLARLAWEHPSLMVEVHTNDAFVDIVAEGFDAGVRLGESVQQDMVTVRLTPPFNAILVAAPSYLRAKGMPAKLEELAKHNCIGFRLLGSGSLYDWELKRDGSTVAMKTRGTAVITDATYARDLALEGIGIAYIFEPLVRSDLREGRLQQVLPDAAFEEDGLFLYFPRRASMSPKLRAFIDIARAVSTGY